MSSFPIEQKHVKFFKMRDERLLLSIDMEAISAAFENGWDNGTLPEEVKRITKEDTWDEFEAFAINNIRSTNLDKVILFSYPGGLEQ